MTQIHWSEFNPGRRCLGRLPHKQDLLTAIADFCQAAAIQQAVFAVTGVVASVTLGTYDQDQQVYVTHKEETPFQIVTCTGNVSQQDGKLCVQAHSVLAAEKGNLVGGQIFSETILWGGELDLQELNGNPLERAYDPETGLWLWKIP
ncbi:MAG: DNA-binding protein [Desulfobacterales bacterium]|nr:MAG: DNA-binding protein [Desulfobacterales bacterium]